VSWSNCCYNDTVAIVTSIRWSETLFWPDFYCNGNVTTLVSTGCFTKYIMVQLLLWRPCDHRNHYRLIESTSLVLSAPVMLTWCLKSVQAVLQNVFCSNCYYGEIVMIVIPTGCSKSLFWPDCYCDGENDDRNHWGLFHKPFHGQSCTMTTSWMPHAVPVISKSILRYTYRLVHNNFNQELINMWEEKRFQKTGLRWHLFLLPAKQISSGWL
jgi:hypothetical protein